VALEVASAAVAKRRSVDEDEVVDVDVDVCCMAPEQERNQPSLRLATDHPSSTRSRIGEAYVCACLWWCWISAGTYRPIAIPPRRHAR